MNLNTYTCRLRIACSLDSRTVFYCWLVPEGRRAILIGCMQWPCGTPVDGDIAALYVRRFDDLAIGNGDYLPLIFRIGPAVAGIFTIWTEAMLPDKDFPSAEEVFPLSWLDFHGLKAPAPKDPQKLLERLYGPDWRSTAKVWSHDFNPFHSLAHDPERVTISIESYKQQVLSAGYQAPRLLDDDVEEALRKLPGTELLQKLTMEREATWLEKLQRRNREQADARSRLQEMDAANCLRTEIGPTFGLGAMDFDFSEDFEALHPHETPLQKLRQEWSNKRPSRAGNASPASPRPQELFPSPQPRQPRQSSGPSPGSPLSVVAQTPNEDAFVSTKASLRRREYEKLEMWISSGGAVEDFAPWFREMLMDQDDDALVSALRAVAAHYRRCAQQQALGEENSNAPVPVCWLVPLAERLMSSSSDLVAYEASELVAACLACTWRHRSFNASPHCPAEKFTYWRPVRVCFNQMIGKKCCASSAKTPGRSCLTTRGGDYQRS
eukprot:s4117_g1.t1